MKQLLVIFSILLLMNSCKKSDTVLPLVVTKADFTTNYKPAGTGYSFFKTNLAITPVAVPVKGADQTWDFSALSDTATLNFGGFTAPSNAIFPAATFVTSSMIKFSLGGLGSPEAPGNFFYELSDAGLFELGSTLNAGTTLSIPSIGGTLTYGAQNLNYTGTAKLPFFNLPAQMGDSVVTSNINYASSYTANAPALGVVNTPGQTKLKITVTNIIIGNGTANLKGIGNKRVLVQKHIEQTQTNYFLGGAPTPTALLTQLGITDGAITTNISYDFFAEGLGQVAKIAVNAAGAVTEARFRKG
jgi:hypothetical protein